MNKIPMLLVVSFVIFSVLLFGIYIYSTLDAGIDTVENHYIGNIWRLCPHYVQKGYCDFATTTENSQFHDIQFIIIFGLMVSETLLIVYCFKARPSKNLNDEKLKSPEAKT